MEYVRPVDRLVSLVITLLQLVKLVTHLLIFHCIIIMHALVQIPVLLDFSSIQLILLAMLAQAFVCLVLHLVFAHPVFLVTIFIIQAAASQIAQILHIW
jgi:hypothetical protein